MRFSLDHIFDLMGPADSEGFPNVCDSLQLIYLA